VLGAERCRGVVVEAAPGVLGAAGVVVRLVEEPLIDHEERERCALPEELPFASGLVAACSPGSPTKVALDLNIQSR
jgi:hypothetical protein